MKKLSAPPGVFQSWTVHQAKGLEFPFVFVAKLGINEAQVGAEHELEDALRQFQLNPLSSDFRTQERADQDQIRFFYVAYSRAIYSLVLLTTTSELRNQGIGFGDNGRQWFTDKVQRLN